MSRLASLVGRESRWLAALVLAALALRLAGFWFEGHRGDLRAFELWAEGLARHGLGGYYPSGGDANYPAMLYFLWPLGVAYDKTDLWTAIRLLSIPFDVALGILLYGVGRRLAGPDAGWTAAAFYLLNPAVVLSGTYWGQVDGMGALPMAGAIVAIAGGGLVWAGVLATLAGLVKPQFGVAAFVLAGLMVTWLATRGGIRRASIVALAALLTFVAVLLPLNLDPIGYRQIMGSTFDRYPYISQFGFNPWGMIFGFGTRDDDWFLIGTALTLIVIGLSLLLLRRRRDLVGLLAVGALIGLAIYFVPTRVHERYLYGGLVLLAPLAAAFPRLRNPFLVLSGLFFVTVAYVAATSPYDILPVPDWAREDLSPFGISLLSAAMTLAGGWTAWRVVELFRSPGSALDVEGDAVVVEDRPSRNLRDA